MRYTYRQPIYDIFSDYVRIEVDQELLFGEETTVEQAEEQMSNDQLEVTPRTETSSRSKKLKQQKVLSYSIYVGIYHLIFLSYGSVQIRSSDMSYTNVAARRSYARPSESSILIGKKLLDSCFIWVIYNFGRCLGWATRSATTLRHHFIQK